MNKKNFPSRKFTIFPNKIFPSDIFKKLPILPREVFPIKAGKFPTKSFPNQVRKIPNSKVFPTKSSQGDSQQKIFFPTKNFPNKIFPKSLKILKNKSVPNSPNKINFPNRYFQTS